MKSDEFVDIGFGFLVLDYSFSMLTFRQKGVKQGHIGVKVAPDAAS